MDHYREFLKFVGEIVSPTVKVIFTSAKFNSDLVAEKEGFTVKKIQKLGKKDAVGLFMKKIPLGDGDKDQFLDYQNIEELHKATIDKYGKDAAPKLCKQRHAHTKTCINNYLVNHPIFEFLGGIPLVISIVAPFAVEKSITEIFLYLAERDDEKKGEDLNSKLQDRIEESALIDSLEYCTTHFIDKGRKLLELWYMIGVQGPGILNTDLLVIFAEEESSGRHDSIVSLETAKKQPRITVEDKENGKEQTEGEAAAEGKPKWENMTSEEKLYDNIEYLLNFSVIEVENLDKAGNVKRFRVSPFVNKYIQEKMPKMMRIHLLELVCTHLQTKLIEFKQEYAAEIVLSKSQEESEKCVTKLQEQIKPYEHQIMHIVSQMFKLEKSDEDQEEEDSFGSDDDEETDQEVANADPVKNPNLLSADTSTTNKTRPGSKAPHKRAPSRDVPNVSDYVKYARSTFHEKSPNNHP